MIPQKIQKTFHESSRGLIVILCEANLEIDRIGKSKDANVQLLDCDNHSHYLTKNKKNPANYRPDITHQCLLTLLDSPLNKAGLLKIYIHTCSNVLIEVHSQIRLPRTFPRFAGLMAQLLQKLSIRSSTEGQKLLQVIKNPITDHLPPNCLKIGLSYDASYVNINDFVKDNANTSQDKSVAFFVGAMAHGRDEFGEFIDKKIAISKYPLSASIACNKICNAGEQFWNIL